MRIEIKDDEGKHVIISDERTNEGFVDITVAEEYVATVTVPIDELAKAIGAFTKDGTIYARPRKEV